MSTDDSHPPPPPPPTPPDEATEEATLVCIRAEGDVSGVTVIWATNPVLEGGLGGANAIAAGGPTEYPGGAPNPPPPIPLLPLLFINSRLVMAD